MKVKNIGKLGTKLKLKIERNLKIKHLNEIQKFKSQEL
jgi:hypothetical protein